jgi:hypothetical protein
MKKLLLPLLLLVCVTSCSDEPETVPQTTKPVPNDNYMMFEYGTTDEYHIQEIDGCEYILVNGTANHEPALTHKGNCKYCLERDKKIVNFEPEKEEY